jgi:hypothetical protein
MERRHLLYGGAGLAVIAAVVLFLVLRNRSDGTGDGSGAETPAGGATAGPGATGGRAAARPGTYRPRTAAESPRIDINKTSEHATGIDRRLAQLTAMLDATGATPCETAYNATVAERKVAAETGKRTIFEFVAERDEFLRVCQSLPEATQRCMQPMYVTENREECEPLRPPNEVMRKMLISRKDENMFPPQEEPKEGTPRPTQGTP